MACDATPSLDLDPHARAPVRRAGRGRSDYFHAEHTRAAIKRGTADVQAAYAAAASQIASIDPPAVAAELHHRLADTWRKRASQLEKAVAVKPLDTGRIDDLMSATDRDVSTAELYTLPQ